MRVALFLGLVLTLAACRDDRTAAPTAEQNQQLNEAEELLNDQAEANVTLPQ
jgi:hypothetical protein